MNFTLRADEADIGRWRLNDRGEGLGVVAMAAGDDHHIGPGIDWLPG